MQSDNHERRRYFRIEDEVILHFKPVQPGEVSDKQSFREYDAAFFALPAKLELLTRESRPQLRRIEREYPEMGGYLRILEQKIELIAAELMAREAELLEQPTRKVSLSASGLAFEGEEGFMLGDMLEFKMLLPPALVGIIAYGRVVYCRLVDDLRPTYQIAVDFIDLCERDRELLIRHVIRRQMQQLRARKQASDAPGD